MFIDNLPLSHSLDIWRLSVLSCSLLQHISFMLILKRKKLILHKLNMFFFNFWRLDIAGVLSLDRKRFVSLDVASGCFVVET